MKKKLLLLATLIIMGASLSLKAAGMLGYQANLTDNEGKALISTPVTFNISIHQGTPTGPTVYSEAISTETSPTGLAYINIGNNGGMTQINDLDWTATSYFLEVSYDFGKGNRSLGCTKIMSVPRAIHADTASSMILTSPSGKKFKVVINDNGELTATPLSE